MPDLEAAVAQLALDLRGLEGALQDIGLKLSGSVDRAAARLVAELAAGGPTGLAARRRLDEVLWPDCPPEAVPQFAGWWHTPLGRLVAANPAPEDAGVGVTRTVAAAMLGVTPGTVAQLGSRGTLMQTTDGKVVKAAILARLAASVA